MTFDLDTHFQSWDFSRDHAHIDRAHLIISVQEGHREILIQLNVRNQHIYISSYEATYIPTRCLFFEQTEKY